MAPSPKGEGWDEGQVAMHDSNFTPYARKLRRNQTDAEKFLWRYLRNKQIQGIKFRRQFQIGKYIVDFVALDERIVIELDGSQHGEFQNQKHDQERTKWLTANNYRVVRFWDNEVLTNVDGALEKIRSLVAPPHPNPLPRERE